MPKSLTIYILEVACIPERRSRSIHMKSAEASITHACVVCVSEVLFGLLLLSVRTLFFAR